MRIAPHAFIPVLATAASACTLLAVSSAAWAAGDATAGQQVFARCAACHSAKPGENKIGPSLAGVVGRRSGTEAGYNYSPALKAANITWDDHSLDQFLANPTSDVHGTKMFISVPNATDRENVIAYLQTLK
jgi:cytochrome c